MSNTALKTNDSEINKEPVFKFFFKKNSEVETSLFKSPRIGDAGFDIASSEDIQIDAGAIFAIPTNLYLEIPLGYVGLIRDRSSVALRGGHTLAGVIDSSYRGEVKVVLVNLSKETIYFKRGDRVAQLVVVRHLQGDNLIEVSDQKELLETERETAGFGSTGR